MLRRNHIGAFALCMIAILIVYHAYYHQQRLGMDDALYAEKISYVLSIFTSRSEDGPVHASQGYVLFEDRAVLLVFAFAVLLVLFALSIVVWDLVSYGKNKYALQLVFSTVLIIIGIISLILDLGLLNYL